MQTRVGLLVALVGCGLFSSVHAQADIGIDRPGFPGMGGFGGSPSGGIVALASSGPIPANGALLLINDLLINIIVTAQPADGASTTPVDGALRQIEGVYWSWTPATPLAPGNYVLQVRLDDGVNPTLIQLQTPFSVVEAIELAPPALTAEPAVSWVSKLFGQMCCQRWTQLGIETGACTATEQRASVQLGPGLASPEPQALLGQFLYRIWPAGEDRTGYAFNPWGVAMMVELEEQADEYCFELETLSIVDGTRTTHGDLEPRCAAHGDLAPIGTEKLQLPESFLDKSECQEPPTPLVEEWCEVNASCDGDRSAEGCVLFGHLCEGEALPLWSPELGVVSDAGVDSGTAGTGGATADGGGGAGGMSGGSDDCSVAQPGARRATTSALGWLALALACTLRARYKRTR